MIAHPYNTVLHLTVGHVEINLGVRWYPTPCLPCRLHFKRRRDIPHLTHRVNITAAYGDLIFDVPHHVHHGTYQRWACRNHFTGYAVIPHTL